MSGIFNAAIFNNRVFNTGVSSTPVGGHGSGEGEGAYDEPRRVFIQGKPYTVRSRQEYLGLIARGKRDKARESADEAIARSQDVAREATLARSVDPVTAETATLLHALLAREEAKRPQILPMPTMPVYEIPVEILMLVAAEL